MPVLDRTMYSPAEDVQRGAYVLADIGDHDPELILMATGSEVDLIIKAGERLAAEGKNVRLVSFPSWELFRKQEKSYQELVLNPKIKKRLSVEAGVAQGWREWVGDKGIILSIDRFGASAPAGRIYEEFGLTVDDVIRKSEELLRKVG
jgi:transketolase